MDGRRITSVAICCLLACLPASTGQSSGSGSKAKVVGERSLWPRAGDELKLECRTTLAQGGRFTNFIWNEKIVVGQGEYTLVSSANDPRVNQTYTGGKFLIPDGATPYFECGGICGSDVIIQNLTSADSGSYRCEYQVISKAGKFSEMFHVSVLDEPDEYLFQVNDSKDEQGNDRLYSENDTVVLFENQTTKISCLATNSFPAAKLTWLPPSGALAADFANQTSNMTSVTPANVTSKVSAEVTPRRGWTGLPCRVEVEHPKFRTKTVQMKVDVYHAHVPGPDGFIEVVPDPNGKFANNLDIVGPNKEKRYELKYGQKFEIECKLQDRGNPPSVLSLLYREGSEDFKDVPTDKYERSNTSDILVYTVGNLDNNQQVFLAQFNCFSDTPYIPGAPALLGNAEVNRFTIQATAPETRQGGMDDATVAAVVTVCVLILVIGVAAVAYIVYRRRRTPGALPPSNVPPTTASVGPEVSQPTLQLREKPPAPMTYPPGNPPNSPDEKLAGGGGNPPPPEVIEVGSTRNNNEEDVGGGDGGGQERRVSGGSGGRGSDDAGKGVGGGGRGAGGVHWSAEVPPEVNV